MIEATPEGSFFYTPFKDMPGFTPAEQARLRADAVKIIHDVVQPAYAQLLTFMRTEYLPRLRTTLAPSGNKPQWFQAVLSEITPLGVFITIACLSWTYDNRLMARAVLVFFGLSLVVRALMPAVRATPDSLA